MKNQNSVFIVIIWMSVINTYIGIIVALEFQEYLKCRNNLIQEEHNMSFGSDIRLEENEKIADSILRFAKSKEINQAYTNQKKFLPASNFLGARKEIEKSKVFKIMKILPKGALLHAHDLSTASQEYILQNITYRSHLYVCELNNELKLKFFETPDEECQWESLSELRKNSTMKSVINERIQQHISISEEFSGVDEIWSRFLSIYDFLPSLLTFKPVYEDYFYQWLQELYDDKVLYLEFRTPLYTLYDLSGKKYETMDTIRILKNISDKFVADHPDFVGVKIIYSVRRNVDEVQMEEYLKIAKKLKQNYPSFIAGFDMDGGENNEKPLIYFAEKLLSTDNAIRFFFHAGETNWNGLSSDLNLIDAVLLNATRIGHGFAILNHPKVLELLKERIIAIEVNPISNQVLGLVSDLRNHPARLLFAENYPVVISCDNPSFWGAKGLSHDFYEAFMGLMSHNSDLRALKKLVMNSLLYSVMTEVERHQALEILEKQWQIFLSEIAQMDKEE